MFSIYFLVGIHLFAAPPAKDQECCIPVECQASSPKTTALISRKLDGDTVLSVHSRRRTDASTGSKDVTPGADRLCWLEVRREDTGNAVRIWVLYGLSLKSTDCGLCLREDGRGLLVCSLFQGSYIHAYEFSIPAELTDVEPFCPLDRRTDFEKANLTDTRDWFKPDSLLVQAGAWMGRRALHHTGVSVSDVRWQAGDKSWEVELLAGSGRSTRLVFARKENENRWKFVPGSLPGQTSAHQCDSWHIDEYNRTEQLDKGNPGRLDRQSTIRRSGPNTSYRSDAATRSRWSQEFVKMLTMIRSSGIARLQTGGVMNSIGSIIPYAGVTLLAADSVGENDASMVARAILVDCDKARYALGEPINVTVVYRNSSAEPWRLVQPDMCTSVRYTLDGKKESIGSYSFSRMRSVTSHEADGGRFEAYFAPRKKWIVIPPGKERQLQVDIFFREWLGHLGPGVWVVWAHHPFLEPDSNRCKFRIDFNRDSVPILLRLVRDPTTPPDQTRWLAKWLERLRPDLVLQWPVPSDTTEQRELKLRRISAELDRFADWWMRESDSKTVEERISTMNQNAIKSLRYDYRACK